MSTPVAEQLTQMRRREPFQPFRVFDKEGARYDILHPSEVMVTSFVVVLPVRAPGVTDLDDAYPAAVALGKIERIEVINPAPPNGVAR